MARTRLRQIEQVRSSYSYDDYLNMGASAESQPGDDIGSGSINDFPSTSTVEVAGDFVSDDDGYATNVNDTITIAGSTSNDGIYVITALSYNSGTDETTFTVEGSPFTVEVGAGTVSTKIDTKKNLRRDLDHIRTQLRKLNRKPNWFDEPTGFGTDKYESKTGSSYSANTDVILSNSETYDAGEPYTMKVYFNGQLLVPSTVSGGSVIAHYDYEERDVSGLVGVGEIGDRFQFNFAIDETDILQFKWEKE